MVTRREYISREAILRGHYARIVLHCLLGCIRIAVSSLYRACRQETVSIRIRRIFYPGRIRVPSPVDRPGGIRIEETAGTECTYIDDDIVSPDACIEGRAATEGKARN